MVEWPAAGTALLDRVRAALTGEPSTREVAMFGGRAFMVADEMVVSAHRDGDLLVRVPRARDAELLERPGASRPVMGTRSMGPGWISVSASTIAADGELAFWMRVALAHRHRTIT